MSAFRTCIGLYVAGGIVFAAAARAGTIVVASYDEPPYRQAVSGARSVLDNVEIHYLTNRGISAAREAVRHAGNDAVYVTFGARAASLVLNNNRDAFLVGCMLLSGEALKPFEHAQAVTLDIAVAQQVSWLQRLMPNAKNIGIVYDQGENTKKVELLAQALRAAGLSPRLAAITGPADLPSALDRLADQIDVLLGLPDQTVYTPQTAKAILLYSFRQRVPLVGLSRSWVKAGALYALEWNYEELGRYCGRLAARRPAATRSLAAPPLHTTLALNLRTAAFMKIRWSEQIRALARIVYE